MTILRITIQGFSTSERDVRQMAEHDAWVTFLISRMLCFIIKYRLNKIIEVIFVHIKCRAFLIDDGVGGTVSLIDQFT